MCSNMEKSHIKEYILILVIILYTRGCTTGRVDVLCLRHFTLYIVLSAELVSRLSRAKELPSLLMFLVHVRCSLLMLHRRSGPRSVSDWGLFSVLHQAAYRQSNLSLPSPVHGLRERDRQTDRQRQTERELRER